MWITAITGDIDRNLILATGTVTTSASNMLSVRNVSETAARAEYVFPEEAEKACHKGNNRHLKGLNSFAEEYAVRDLILVSNDPAQRRMGNCNVLPWKVFLEKLWAGEIIA